MYVANDQGQLTEAEMNRLNKCYFGASIPRSHYPILTVWTPHSLLFSQTIKSQINYVQLAILVNCSDFIVYNQVDYIATFAYDI